MLDCVVLTMHRPIGRYRRSIHKKITDILKDDTSSFAACLFQVANCTLFVHKKSGFRVRIMSSCRSGVSAASFKDVTDFLPQTVLSSDSVAVFKLRINTFLFSQHFSSFSAH